MTNKHVGRSFYAIIFALAFSRVWDMIVIVSRMYSWTFYKLKILYPIILSIAVYMMHHLLIFKRSTYMIGHNISMLINSAILVGVRMFGIIATKVFTSLVKSLKIMRLVAQKALSIFSRYKTEYFKPLINGYMLESKLIGYCSTTFIKFEVLYIQPVLVSIQRIHSYILASRI